MVELLMNIVSPNALTNNRWCAIHYAAMNGHVNVLEMLLRDKRVIFNGTTILTKARNSRGRQALHLAAQYGQLEAVRFLLSDPRIDPLSVADDMTAFEMAAEAHHVEIAHLLFDRCSSACPTAADRRLTRSICNNASVEYSSLPYYPVPNK